MNTGMGAFSVCYDMSASVHMPYAIIQLFNSRE